LVRQGLLREDEYRSVLSRLSGEDKRFGEVVTELGLMTDKEVDAALAVQVRLKVMRCLGWEKVKHTFEPDADRAKNVPRHPTRVEPLLLAAARMFDADRLGAALAPARGKFPHLRGYADALAERFQIGVAAVRLLTRMDGARSTEQVLAGQEVEGAEAILA